MFSFVGGEGQTIVADLDRTGGQSDFMVRLFNSRGRELTFARGGDDGRQLQWSLGASDTYYIGISGWGNDRYNARREVGERAGETGDYLLDLSLTESAAAVVTGSDAFGYQAQTDAFNFEDIGGIGRARVGGLADDVSFGILLGSRVGFEFDFYGQRAERFLASSNGHVSFDSGSNYWNNTDLAASPRAAMAAALWDDLFIDPAEGNILVAVRGGRCAPDQRLIVQWDSVRFYGGAPDDTVTFQVVLSEADNAIRFNYQDLVVGNAHTEGQSATAGLRAYGDQRETGNYLAAAYNNSQSPFIGTGRSTVITLNDPGPQGRPASGNVPTLDNSLGWRGLPQSGNHVEEPNALRADVVAAAPHATAPLCEALSCSEAIAEYPQVATVGLLPAGEMPPPCGAIESASSSDDAVEDDALLATPALRTLS